MASWSKVDRAPAAPNTNKMKFNFFEYTKYAKI